MSEKILNALMLLFAIIARPNADGSERREVVRAFLEAMLNQDLVNQYLKVYDIFFSSYQSKQGEGDKQKKNVALSSVKILKICHEINLELTFQQKRIVLIRLIQFIKTNQEINAQELEFVETVASAFFISDEEYNKIKDFILLNFDEMTDSSQLLEINDSEINKNILQHHICVHALRGRIKIFNIDTTSLFILRYQGNDELYINSQLITPQNVYIVSFGASIRNTRIKPIFYSDITRAFYSQVIKDHIIYEVENISHKFANGKIGIHPSTFSENSGNLIGIMGSSGAGKTTMVNILNGFTKPTSGGVKINGIDIYEQPKAVEGLIGHVPQDDLLIEELTVFQNLYLNSKLCFGNLSRHQINRKVLKTLQNLGLYEIRNMIVGSPLNKKISGGQRKRLNIALELIREPAILFLDEPTSGLSSRDSENIMYLLKDLTTKGKLIFTVIHQPSSDIFKMFDKLLMLDTGGYMIYYGNPVDSITYFKSNALQADWTDSECAACGNVNSEQIFNIVESLIVDEYGNLTKTRKIPPKEWHQKYLTSEKKAEIEVKNYDKVPEIEFKPPSKFSQFKTFVTRDVLSKLANTQYLIINFSESIILAGLLAFIIKFFNVDASNEIGYTLFDNSNLPVFIFMSVIVAIFIGLTVSAEEIIKDRKILNRERSLNLSWTSYLCSKITILMVISAFQAFTFVLAGNFIMEIKGMYFHYWLALFTVWVGSNLMGLIISDSFKTVVTIYILIPFLVIPHLILSGILVPYDKLNPRVSSPTSIPFYGEIISARWIYEALAVYQYKENKYERNFYQYERALSLSIYKKDYWVKSLKNKLNFIDQYEQEPTKKQEVANAKKLITNEITKELKSVKLPDYITISPDFHKLGAEEREQIDNYLSYLTNFYINVYNKANDLKDGVIQELEESLGKSFIKMKDQYTNRSLTEFVKNSNSIERIIEYENNLYQKMDPIYQMPENKFIKAHFYSPFKQVFGTYFSTYWVNIIVVWIMNIIFFIILKYRGLYALLNRLGKLNETFKKQENQ